MKPEDFFKCSRNHLTDSELIACILTAFIAGAITIIIVYNPAITVLNDMDKCFESNRCQVIKDSY